MVGVAILLVLGSILCMQGLPTTQAQMTPGMPGYRESQSVTKELSLRLQSLETYLNVQYNERTKTHTAK